MKAIFGDGLSSIRGGYRISYDVLFYNILTVNASNFPRVVVGQITSPNTQNLYPNVAPVTGQPVFNPLATYVNTPENAVNPYSQLFSLSWQREFARDYVLEVGYTGSRSNNQIWQRKWQHSPRRSRKRDRGELASAAPLSTIWFAHIDRDRFARQLQCGICNSQ
jgi:hypothetical protein